MGQWTMENVAQQPFNACENFGCALRCWVIELFNNLRKIKRHPARCSKFQSSMVLGAWLDSNFNARCLLEVRKNGNQINSKNSFLRALMEVAPEMELFLENHAQYIKIFVMKLIYIQSCTFRHLTKKLYHEEYVWKDVSPHFFAENLSQTLL